MRRLICAFVVRKWHKTRFLMARLILINIERVSKHSVTIRGLRVVTTCWSWAWTNRTSPSEWVELGSPLAACSVYGCLTCSVHTVNNLCLFNCQWHFYLCKRGPYVTLTFVPNMVSSWKQLLLLLFYYRFQEETRLTAHILFHFRCLWWGSGCGATAIISRRGGLQ